MENQQKRKTKTSSKVINRYKAKTYETFRFMVRYDAPLHDKIKAYDGNLSELIRNLLAKYLNENSDT
jgi:hypothetical protein